MLLSSATQSLQSKATDFLDFYDILAGKVYFVGVLDKQYDQRVATYFKISDMIGWIQKYLGKIIEIQQDIN